MTTPEERNVDPHVRRTPRPSDEAAMAGHPLHAAFAFARRPMVLAVAALAILSAVRWHQGSRYIEDVSSTLIGIHKLVSGDSEHYLAIADALREGDFRMTHVEPTGAADRAHRQPGYPALLAAAQELGVQGAPSLALVNLAMLILSMWIALLGVRLATGSALAGLLSAAVIYDAPFLYEIATERLLTEPLYVAVAVGAVTSCLWYARRLNATALLAGAVLAGLAYLVRVNGLFLAATLAFVLVAADVQRALRSGSPTRDLPLHVPLEAWFAALALFVVVTVPSWLPRTIYAGNPVYHGYLSNYLWVDDYERAHTPGPPKYSLETYAAEHTATEAAKRMSWGMKRVFWETPRDKFGIVTTILLAVAVVVLAVLGDRAGLAIAIAGMLQALPLAWTAVANPARRLPAAALLPFAAVVIGAAAAALLQRTAAGSPSPSTEA